MTYYSEKKLKDPLILELYVLAIMLLVTYKRELSRCLPII
nr:MAG TPA: hypothetical protein [Crassvirales sp.]